MDWERSATVNWETYSGERSRGRSKITPAVAVFPRSKAISPKPLSNVSSTRPSACDRARTASSLMPGEISRKQVISTPAWRVASTGHRAHFHWPGTSPSLIPAKGKRVLASKLRRRNAGPPGCPLQSTEGSFFNICSCVHCSASSSIRNSTAMRVPLMTGCLSARRGLPRCGPASS
jgi:hypothetical protein